MVWIDVFYVHYVIDDILFAFFPIVIIPFDRKVPLIKHIVQCNSFLLIRFDFKSNPCVNASKITFDWVKLVRKNCIEVEIERWIDEIKDWLLIVRFE